jgi:hypothetical protein
MLDIDLDVQLKDLNMSLEDVFKEETPYNLTHKFVKELA